LANNVYLSAGVYPSELDFTQYVSSVGTIALGIVAVTERGVEGETGANTAITSWSNFQVIAGSYRSDSYGAYAARSYFDNGGGNAYVSRVLKTGVDGSFTTGSVRAAAALVDITTPTALPILQVNARSFGTWGNKLSVTIVPNTKIYADGFNLNVYYKNDSGVPTLVESFTQCTMNNTKQDYAISKVHSQYIVLTNPATPSVKTIAAQTVTLLGGLENVTGLVDLDYTNAIDNFATSPITLLIIPGNSSAAVLDYAITFAEKRNDVIVIADTAQGLLPADAIAYRENSSVPFNSCFAAMYYPWLGISDPLNNCNKVIPPSGAVAGVYCRGAVWEAPAGVDLGVLNNVTYMERKLAKADMDLLYADNINPITSFLDTGAVIWGQKTLQIQTTDRDRVNVRRLMSYLETSIDATCKTVVFKANIKSTWSLLERRVKPFLQRVEDAGGIYDFLFVCDSTNNTSADIDEHIITIDIYIKPTITAEFIKIQYILTPTGSTWKEVSSLVS